MDSCTSDRNEDEIEKRLKGGFLSREWIDPCTSDRNEDAIEERLKGGLQRSETILQSFWGLRGALVGIVTAAGGWRAAEPRSAGALTIVPGIEGSIGGDCHRGWRVASR